METKHQKLVWLGLGLWIIACGFLMGCGGGSKSETKIDEEGPLTSINALEDLVVDQLAFYVDDDSASARLEVWILDAKTNKPLLCSDGSIGMEPVQTESVIYGKLHASFRRLTQNAAYSGQLFKVRVYNNHSTPCVIDRDDDDSLIDSGDERVGTSYAVNYTTLTTRPIIASNGGFYLRLRTEAAPAFSLPKTVSSVIGNNKLLVDQVDLATAVDFDDQDNEGEVEVHILDAQTDELIGCSGQSQGMRSVTDAGLSYGKLLSDLVLTGSNSVDFDEHLGRQVVVYLVDNDGTACPQAVNPSEDGVLGESAAMLWDELSGATVLMTNGNGSVTFTDVLED